MKEDQKREQAADALFERLLDRHKVATRKAHNTGHVAFANCIKTDGISASVLLSKPKSEKEVAFIRRKRARNAQHAAATAAAEEAGQDKPKKQLVEGELTPAQQKRAAAAAAAAELDDLRGRWERGEIERVVGLDPGAPSGGE